MARNRIHVNAPPEVVFDVLVDPAAYPVWVVGCKRIRGVDASWPEPGARLHHTVGWGLFAGHDTTEVVSIEAPTALRFEARVRPFGTARVDLAVRASGDGTTVEIDETLLCGPAAWIDNPLVQRAVQIRNAVGLHRLRRWAEQHHRATPGHLPDGPR